jgi:hypothetical protein
VLLLVICVLEFTVFCIVSCIYIYVFLLVLSVLPPCDNSIEVSTITTTTTTTTTNNNNNNLR